MQSNKTATIEATVLYADEPQVVTLRSEGQRYLGVAIPDDENKWSFIVAPISDAWALKDDTFSDCLRRPFVEAQEGSLYRIDLATMQDKVVTMVPWVGRLEELHLTAPDATDPA